MKKIRLLFLLFFVGLFSFSQTDSVFILNTLTHKGSIEIQVPGIGLNHCWKYHKGDDLNWSLTSFNDKSWKYEQTMLALTKLPKGTFEGSAWFRLHIKVDTRFINKPLVLMLSQWGASEIFLDGKLLHRFGKIDSVDILKDELYNPQYLPINIQFKDSTNHLLAVRYRNKATPKNINNRLMISHGFDIKISDIETESAFYRYINFFFKAAMVFYFTFFLALGILHFLLYLFYRQNLSNLYYSFFAVSFGFIFVIQLSATMSDNPDTIRLITHLSAFLPFVYSLSLLAMLYTIFYKKILLTFKIAAICMIINYILFEFKIPIKLLNYSIALFILIEPVRIIIASIIKKKKGAWLIGSGVITTIVFLLIFSYLIYNGHSDLIFNQKGLLSIFILIISLLSTVSIPLSMSAFLAREFAHTNKDLQKKLIEVEDLNLKSIEQEKEKQQILADQNITLEKQVKERTHEVVEQKKVIEEKNKDITDSISYAKRIQDATLPSKELKYRLFPEAFVLFKPKDIVSGDFYWFTEIKGIRFIAAADCTGHGVPGAMVSVVCSNAINRAVKEFGVVEPGKILDKVRELVLETFSTQHTHSGDIEKKDGGVKDGMDISLISIQQNENSQQTTVKWAGANNPLWYIQNSELKEITANKQPIGKTDNPLPFTTHTLELNKGDCLYLFTDGYADQFGGPKGKKFKYKQLEDILLSINYLPMLEQETFLDQKFEEWKNMQEQVDDVLVIGVKI